MEITQGPREVLRLSELQLEEAETASNEVRAGPRRVHGLCRFGRLGFEAGLSACLVNTWTKVYTARAETRHGSLTISTWWPAASIARPEQLCQ